MRNRNKELSQASSNHATAAVIGPVESRASAPRQSVSLTHERIAERAKALWLASGCVPGRDEQNWHEAEAQLRAESQSR